jgi:hypothetical protein
MATNPDIYPNGFPREMNYTYAGHTSDIIPTPWPFEGRKALRGTERRIPERHTPEIKHEIDRLAAIENPGRCASRCRHFDKWCWELPLVGATKCRWHIGARKREKQQRAAVQLALNARVRSLVKRASV